MTIKSIYVLGLGNVGILASKLLFKAKFEVTGYDLILPSEKLPFVVKQLDLNDIVKLKTEFKNTDAVLSCLPFHLNKSIAKLAFDENINYFDLTEDVSTTQEILKLGESSKKLMAPQCGLAPGFVGIVGADLISKFDTCRSCKMRVGALPQHPTGLLGYAFNWSPMGVVNEYLNDCEVLENGVKKLVSPMEWLETIIISGMKLEAFTTSGGLGTMCDTYLGKVSNLDYKTMRYPGHMQLMNFFFHELLMRDKKEIAGNILTNAKPPVSNDIVYVHVSSEGDISGKLHRIEYVKSYKPINVLGQKQTAIAWTTAASVTAIIELVRKGKIPNKGFLKQESISLADFFATETGTLYN